jgi:hypothetical protein
MTWDLSDVKVGDYLVSTNIRTDVVTVAKIVKVTANFLNTQTGRKIRKSDGYIVGSRSPGGFSSVYYRKPTGEDMVKWRIQKLQAKFNRTIQALKVTKENYGDIADFVKRFAPETEAEKERQ